MKIAILKERRDNETRVAGSPEVVKKLIDLGFQVAVVIFQVDIGRQLFEGRPHHALGEGGAHGVERFLCRLAPELEL